MINALNTLWLFVTTLITGCNNLASSFEQITSVADDAAGAFKEEQKLIHEKRMNKLKEQVEMSAKSFDSE